MYAQRGEYRDRGVGRHDSRGFERGSTSTCSSEAEPIGEPTEHPDSGGNPAAPDLLDPNGLWFDNDYKVAARVTESIKTFYNGPWTSFSNLPEFAPRIWFRNFKQYYRWDPLIHEEVKRAFIAKAMKSLRQVACRLGKETDVSKTAWCPSEVRQQLLKYRASDKFQPKSIKCTESRTVGEKARTTHAQGSIIAKKLKEKMTVELKRDVSAAEVFERGHFSKKKGKFVDKQADKVWEKFEALKRDNMDNNNDGQAVVTDNDLFFEAVGGWDAKGRLYGLGCVGDLYYENRKSLKRLRTNVDLRMKVANQQQQIDELRAILEQLTQSHHSSPNFPPTPPPPSGSGQGITV